jgi:hypothetical protein
MTNNNPKAIWVATDNLGRKAICHAEFVEALAYFGELWTKKLHQEGRSTSVTISVTSETETQSATFTADYVADGGAA